MEENMWLTLRRLRSRVPGDEAADFPWTVILLKTKSLFFNPIISYFLPSSEVSFKVYKCFTVHLFSQSAHLNLYGVFAILQALWRLLFLQHAAASAAGFARLLGLSHPAYGLQVCVHRQGEEWARYKRHHPHRLGGHRLNFVSIKYFSPS